MKTIVWIIGRAPAGMTGAQREFLFFIFLIFQDISGLAVQRLADVVQGGESYGLRLLVLQDREVGGGDADLRGEVTGGDACRWLCPSRGVHTGR